MLDAKFGMRVLQLNFTYSNILFCYNRKWDKCRFFSLKFMYAANIPRHMYWHNEQKQNKKFEKGKTNVCNAGMRNLCDNNIVCRSDVTYTHIRLNKLIYLTKCRFVHVKTIVGKFSATDFLFLSLALCLLHMIRTSLYFGEMSGINMLLLSNEMAWIFSTQVWWKSCKSC